MNNDTPRIAVIGAGIAGLTCARLLSDTAHVTVFEKARGMGGRMAVRYFDDTKMDFGAQSFTVRSPEFQDFISPFIHSGTVAPWSPRLIKVSAEGTECLQPWNLREPHYIGVPTMNRWLKSVVPMETVKLSQPIARVERSNNKTWSALSPAGECLGQYDWVISTAPAPQTHALFPTSFYAADELLGVQYDACHAVMFDFNQAEIKPSWDAAFIDDGSVLSWVANNASKPGRADELAVVALSDYTWSQQNLNNDSHPLYERMLEAASDLYGVSRSALRFLSGHFWRYAQVVTEIPDDFMFDTEQNLLVCGEMFCGGRVEGAFLSAYRAMEALREAMF
jgi:renalase